MINDIDVTNTDIGKFVDDTTIAECVKRKEVSTIQNAVTEVTDKAHANKFQLSEANVKSSGSHLPRPIPSLNQWLSMINHWRSYKRLRAAGPEPVERPQIEALCIRNYQKDSPSVLLFKTAKKSYYSGKAPVKFLRHLYLPDIGIHMSSLLQHTSQRGH